MEELFDVTALGHRPSAAGPGLVDIDLRGHLRILPEDRWPPAQPPAAQAFLLTGPQEEPLGTCRRTTGVFRERPYPPRQPVTLLGCRPEAPLQALLERTSPQRRHLQATIYAVDDAGLAVATQDLLDLLTDDGVDVDLR
ncbi:hypothetical protein GCM10009555_101870 [Acrocarpospora macrocephala]|uniref:Uncharacterized protein n=1 Tax=Acrocarpospora macrocephala TaxID=150177 RepID=A0A5M3WIX2_9ACTN|nr:hypothetical protein [Acrocarpospora macrocephala]GES07111.1 hypothetical protein Amac_007060 [Acrocarpospora macrocephala]